MSSRRQNLVKKKTRTEFLLESLLWLYKPWYFEIQRKFYAYGTVFYPDFYFRHYRLIVEVDGGIHQQRIGYDSKRDELIQSVSEKKRNILPEVIRFENSTVIQHPLEVIKIIENSIQSRKLKFKDQGGIEDKELLLEAERWENNKSHFLNPAHQNKEDYILCNTCFDVNWLNKKRIYENFLSKFNFKIG